MARKKSSNVPVRAAIRKTEAQRKKQLTKLRKLQREHDREDKKLRALEYKRNVVIGKLTNIRNAFKTEEWSLEELTNQIAFLKGRLT